MITRSKVTPSVADVRDSVSDELPTPASPQVLQPAQDALPVLPPDVPEVLPGERVSEPASPDAVRLLPPDALPVSTRVLHDAQRAFQPVSPDAVPVLPRVQHDALPGSQPV